MQATEALVHAMGTTDGASGQAAGAAHSVHSTQFATQLPLPRQLSGNPLLAAPSQLASWPSIAADMAAVGLALRPIPANDSSATPALTEGVGRWGSTVFSSMNTTGPCSTPAGALLSGGGGSMAFPAPPAVAPTAASLWDLWFGNPSDGPADQNPCAHQQMSLRKLSHHGSTNFAAALLNPPIGGSGDLTGRFTHPM